MSRILHLPTLLFLVWTTLPHGSAWPQENPDVFREAWLALPGLIQSKATEFPEASATEGAEIPRQFEANLRNRELLLPGGYKCTALRIKAPSTPYQDMVWAFSLPDAWSKWGILPLKGGGDTGGGESWFPGDRAYTHPTTPAGHTLRLQSIGYRRFTPGDEHLLWFITHQSSESPGWLRATIHFSRWTRDDEARVWLPADIESTLRLQPASAAEHVALLHSRGGRVLLDPQLFDSQYAESCISSLIATIRRRHSRADFPNPPAPAPPPDSPSHPSLREIQKVHGEPDLVISSRELGFLNPQQPVEKQRLTRAWFDHFALVYDESDPTQAILRVETSDFNFAKARPTANGLSYVSIANPAIPLVRFFKDQREIARISRLGGADAELLSGKLVLGTYQFLSQPRSKEELHLSRWRSVELLVDHC